jgi:ribosomal protein L29
MAALKRKDLRTLPPAEIQKRLKETRVELSKEMSKRATGGAPTKPSTIKNLHKTIARLLTVSNSKDVKRN